MVSAQIMYKKDLITVLVPAFNHDKYIEECIDSIIKQTYQNIELIILNDGSTDKTAEKIKAKSIECEKRFNRFLFIDKENEGVAKTLNMGFLKANGKYVALCASDDTFVYEAIATMHDFLSNNTEYVLAVGNNYFIDCDSKRCFWDSDGQVTYDIDNAKDLSFVSSLQRNRQDIDFNSDSFGTYESLLKGNYLPNGYLLRKDVFLNKVKGFSIRESLEDFFLHLQLSKYGKYKYIDKHLFNYRLHRNNTSKHRELMIRLTSSTLELEKQYASKFKKNNRYKIPYIFEKKLYKYNVCLTSIYKIFGFKMLELIKKLLLK
ncbi:glycosyltransferase family A protein [Prochlorococcus marinus]|uniref:Glycosyltransferase involved in cell wall bioproteinsi n=1 Tax=Prochlorococcus marinus str. PAC1 TaxID=59924 RepID=A0A0A2C5G4_PROMR|nr:glycosyltransferase family 2 protein [Prochlorococcus marinus]KGG20797.1 Glycosyltransferase involved in cell wall bioproteinsi [Prochlorococcus marinus str. PAC1]